ncbi:MAG: MFS transporter [Tissierellia bacterium]|nr:MFS transporter [Tissierellia bacterium]
MRKNVWSKDFTLIIIGTVISAIGGVAMGVPLSLYIFDETGSAFLSSILFISAFIPQTILPVLVAPIIDRSRKKKFIVGLDYLMGTIYILTAIIVRNIGFHFAFYMALNFVFGAINTVYQLAYQSWFPDLIPEGFEQQGFSVSSSIYPSIIIVMSPFATYLYSIWHMSSLFLLVGVLMIIAASFELLISNTYRNTIAEKFSFDDYKKDLLDGIRFIKEEAGIRNIYSYMCVSNGVANGSSILIQSHFQTSSSLTLTMLAFLKSIEMVGRIIAGFIQYKIVIPPKKRYGITKFVYIFYDIMDGILLFLPYPLMMINRFLAGFAGMTSATVRETAIQAYLPPDVRAKVNALFSVAVSMSIILFQLIAGSMGDLIGFRISTVILALITLVGVIIFIIKPTEINKKVYESSRV